MATSAAAAPRGLTADRLALAALAAMVILSPLFRGLYFPGPQLVAVIAIALAFAAAAWRDAGRERLVAQPLDAAVLGLALAYVASIATAADRRAALQWALIYIACFMVYWLTSRVASRGSESVNAVVLLHALLASTVGVALVGIAAAADLIEVPGAMGGGRIASTLQYANTTASFLTAGLVLSLSLWSRREAEAEERVERVRGWRAWLWPAAGYAACGWLLLTVIVFTQSRGALLVLPIVLLLNVLLAPAGKRLGLVTRTAVVVCAAAVTLVPMGIGIRRDTLAGLLPLIVLGAGAATIALLPLHARLCRVEAGRRSILTLTGVGAVVITAVVVIVPRFLPDYLLRRVGAFGLREYSAWSRIRFTEDAFRALRDHPWLGIGGGGWEHLQYVYQSYGYTAKHVHNHFIQVPLETGLPGTIVFLALWVAAGLAAWSALRSAGQSRRWIVAGTFSAVAALGLHSIIDFNLAIAAVTLSLWMLFGVVAAVRPARSAENTERGAIRPLPLRVAAGGGLAVAAVAGALYVAYAAGQRGARLLADREPARAKEHLERALRFDPLNSRFAMDLGLTQEAAGDLPRAEESFRKAIRLSPSDAELHASLGRFFLRHDRADDGLASLRRASALRPFSWRLYGEIAREQMTLGGLALQSGDRTRAIPHLRAAVEQRERLDGLRRREPAIFAGMLRRHVPGVVRIPRVLPQLEYDAGRAMLLLGRPREALTSLQAAAGEGMQNQNRRWHRRLADQAGSPRRLKPDVWAWLTVAAERSGESQKAGEYRAKALEDPRTAAMIPAISQLAARGAAGR